MGVCGGDEGEGKFATQAMRGSGRSWTAEGGGEGRRRGEGAASGESLPGTRDGKYKIPAVHAHPVTVRGSWWYVPFVLKDCGRPGVEALAFSDGEERESPLCCVTSTSSFPLFGISSESVALVIVAPFYG